jgi:hypothetical protein
LEAVLKNLVANLIEHYLHSCQLQSDELLIGSSIALL